MSETNELYDAFKADTANHRAFDALVKRCVADDDRETLTELYAQLPEWAPDGDQSPIFRVMNTQARVNKEAPIGSFLHYNNGLLLWKHYAQPQKAEMAFRKVLIAPQDPSLLREFYLDFYTAQNNWRRLEQFLSDPSRGGLDDPIEVKRMLAKLALDAGQPDKAIGFWQGVRVADRQDAEATAQLRALYEQVGKWHAMVDLLKDSLKDLEADDVAGRIAVHTEMVSIYKDRMNAPSKVVSSWQAILSIDPSNANALDALADEYTEMRRWPDLVKILQQKVRHQDDTAALISLHEQIADIMLERFSNTSEAIKSYEAILALDPENQQAISVLKDIYEKRRDWDAYIQISERELGLLSDGDEKNERFIGLARLASERIRKPQTPIALWERVLNANEEHAEALSQLETLYEREKNFRSLVSILDKRIGLETDISAQVALLEKLAMVAQVRLHDAERATEVYKQILERDRDHRKAQAELKKRYIAERDWDNLEWFFRTYGEVSEWVRTLESQAKSMTDADQKTALLFGAAAVWRDELGETRRAVKNLEAVLEQAPSHGGAARMLIPIYLELSQFKRLPGVYEIVLESSEDPVERRATLLANADVQEHQLGDVDSAFFAYVQAVSEAPDAVDLHPELARLAAASQNWEAYVYVLQEAVDQIDAVSDRIDVMMEIGGVYRQQLGSTETALEFFNRVLHLDEYNRAAILAAEAAYDEAGAWDQLLVIFHKKLTIAADQDERKDTLFKLADVWGARIGDNAEAEAILREMLPDFPEEVRVHDALIAIHLAERRYDALAEVLELKRDVLLTLGLNESAPGRLADIECELGMLAYGTRPDGENVTAAVGYYETALGHDPAHAATVLRLEELLADESVRLQITRILEPVFTNGMAWAKLAQMLEIQHGAAVAEEDEHAQTELLGRLAGLYRDPLADKDLAWRSFGRLFALTPESAEVRAEFERLSVALERFEPLVTVYTQHADEPLDKHSRLGIKLEVARTWHKRLASLEEARVFYHKVLDEEPEHKEALDALEGIYVDLDRAEDLLGVYRRKVELTQDTEQKLDYLFRTSDLLRDRLQQPDEAIGAAREALDLVPGHLPAVQRLDELYTLTERWQELATTLEETIALVDGDDERVVLLRVRLAGVYDRHLEDPTTAIALYASVFELDANNAATVEALERLFEDESLAPAIAPIIEPHYDHTGDWQKLVEVYIVREAAADDCAEKIAWHYKTAELYEVLGEQPESAFEHYMAAAALEPGSEQTMTELLRLGDQLGNHAELILFLGSIVEDIDDDGRRIATHRTIAALARDKTRDMSGAEKQLRAILEIDPSDMPATDDLIALYRYEQHNARLVEMLLHKAPMDVDAILRHDLYAEAGEISAGVLEKPEQAIEIFETLHGLDPNQSRALNALEGLYERVEDWDNLVRIYREKIDRASDVDTRKTYASLMGYVQADKQESPDDAIQTWRTILEWDPAALDALDELDGLYSAQEDWFSLLDVLRKKQELVDGDAWETAQLRIAKLYESDEQLGDIMAAIDAHGALLQRNSGHEGATSSLKDILAATDAYERAFEVLSPVLQARQDHEELWNQYEVLAGHQSDDPTRKVATLHAMAELAEIALEDPERALDAQSRAFAIDSRNTTTAAELGRLAQSYGAWETLVGIYAAAAEDADDDYHARSLRLYSGAVLMEQICDPQRAIATYAKVYKDFPDHLEVQDRLHRLYESEEMHEALAEVLRQQIETTSDEAVKLEHLEGLARLSEVQLADTATAVEAFNEMLDLRGDYPLAVTELRRLFDTGVSPLEIAERLDPIYRRQEDWDALDSLLQRKLASLDDEGDRMQLLQEIARLNLGNKNDKAAALGWFGQAFQLDPEDDGLLHQLRELATEIDAWESYQPILMSAARACEDDDRKVTLWHEAAAVSRDRLGASEAAEEIYRLVLATDDVNLAALRALDTMYSGQERWQELEPIVAAEASNDDVYDDERVGLFVRLAELYRDRLDARDKSVAAWRDVLELNDVHQPALMALKDMHLEDERWQELFGILEQLYDTAREDADRVTYASDMARIAETALENPDKAVELWEDVLAAAPNDFGAIHELQRLLGEQESWQGLVEAYDRELRMGVDDPARRLRLHRQMGRLWYGKLDDAFSAQQCWERALEEAPTDKDALDALRTIHGENENDMALAEVVEASIDSGHYEAPEQLALWRQLATLRTEVFGDAPKGIDAWRAVLELAPGDGTAIEQLEQLYETQARWPDLVDLYRLKLHHITDEGERLENWISLGTIQQENLQDVEAAAQTYRDILDHLPSHAEASQRLEQIYEQTENWEALGPLLLDRNEYVEDVEDRLANLQRLARVYEDKLSQPDNAFLVLQRANEEVRDEANVLSELERLAAGSALWAELYEVYEGTLPHLEGDAAIEAMLKSATVQRDQIGDPLAAIALFERVLESADDNEPALRALVALNESQERWPNLVLVQAGLADVTPDYGERVTLLKTMAGIYEEKLGQGDQAVDAWNLVLDTDEMDREALGALERLHLTREDWPNLIEILDRIASAEPEREGALRLQIGGILETHLGKTDDAIEVYEEVLNYAPGDQTALERLEALYGEREDWTKLIDVYERGYDAAVETQDKIEMARKVAMIHEAIFEDRDAAAEVFHRILSLESRDDEAFSALVRIYNAAQEWDDLVSLYEQRYADAESADERADARLATALIYREHLDDVDNAINMFEDVLLERRTDRAALDALDALYREQELWEQVLGNLERQLEAEQDPARRIELLCAKGELAGRELQDGYRAAEAYQRVLQEKPGHGPAVDALVAIFKSDERWDKVVQTLEHKLDSTVDDGEASVLHVSLAEVWGTRLEDEDKAREHLEQAVDKDPESRAALSGLADYYIRLEDYPKAMPLLELVVDKLDVEADKAELFQVRKRLGRCCEAVYQTEQAIDEYTQAAALLPPDRDTLQALARLHHKKENFAEAERYLQEVIDKYGQDMEADDYTALHLQLGEAALKLGNTDKAHMYLQHVVEKDPSNQGAVAKIVEVLKAHGDWPNAIHYMHQLLSLQTDTVERYQVQLAIGDIYNRQLGDSVKAADAYREALHLNVFPKDPALRLFELAVAQEDYLEAISNLNRLITLEDDPKKKARFSYTAAVLYRDQLNDATNAVKYLNLTLDNNVEDYLQAFRTIDELLTKHREWKPLEQNYRRMIQRVQKLGAAFDKGPALLFKLYEGLGEIYRSRLKRLDYAISAFELARKQRPGDERIREILTGLYEATPEGIPKAIEHHRYLVGQRPDRFTSYHKLVSLYKKVGQPDAAWCVAGVLLTLGQADPEEQRFYTNYLSPSMAEPRRVIDQTLWMQGVMSRGEDPQLGQIFGLIYQGLGKHLAIKPLKAFGLKKKARLNLDKGLLVCTTIKNVQRVFGVAPPDIYEGSEATGLQLLATAPPGLLMGTDLTTGRTDKDLSFLFAKYLTYFHPLHIIATVYGRESLDHLFMAAASLVDPDYTLSVRDDLPVEEQQNIGQQVAEIRAALDKAIPAEVRAQLTEVMDAFWKRNGSPNIGAWHRHVELTANHAGLVACGDIALAGQLIKNESRGLSKLRNSEKLREFVQYVMSDHYLQLRRQLGVQIDYSELMG